MFHDICPSDVCLTTTENMSIGGERVFGLVTLVLGSSKPYGLASMVWSYALDNRRYPVHPGPLHSAPRCCPHKFVLHQLV